MREKRIISVAKVIWKSQVRKVNLKMIRVRRDWRASIERRWRWLREMRRKSVVRRSSRLVRRNDY